MNAGRAETIRYHQALYRDHRVLTPGSWLHKPAAFVLAAAKHLPQNSAVQILDVGCGAGRHSIPLASQLNTRSKLIAFDFLPEAVTALIDAASSHDVQDRIEAHVSDLASFEYGTDCYDLIVACSAIEHCASEHEFLAVLSSIAKATKPGGLICLVVGTDKTEIPSSGIRRPALVEFPLSRTQALMHLSTVYAEWEMLDQSESVFSVQESRLDETYTLENHCIWRLVRKPQT